MWECIFCLCSLTNRASDSRVRYRLTDVLARGDKGKTGRRDKGVEEVELFTQCRTTWTGAVLTRDPDKHQTLLGLAGPLSSGPWPLGSSSLYLRPPHFTYRVWTVKSRRWFLPDVQRRSQEFFRRAKENIPRLSGFVRRLCCSNSPTVPPHVPKTHHGRS